MKKINFKGLGVTSPRKDGRSSGLGCLDSGFASDSEVNMSVSRRERETSECRIQDESRRHEHRDAGSCRPPRPANDVPVPRRRPKRGIFSTLKKKLSNLQKRRDDDSESESNVHDHSDVEERCHSLPCSARNTPKNAPKHRDRFSLAGHSLGRSTRATSNGNGSGRNSDPRMRHSLPRPTTHHGHPSGSQSVNTHRRREFLRDPLHIPQHSQKEANKSETESEKEDSPSSEKELFAYDTAYGHASAPVSVAVNGHSSHEATIPRSYQGTPVRSGRMDQMRNGILNRNGSASTNAVGGQEVYEMYDSAGHRQLVPSLTLVPFYDQVRDHPKSWSLTKELFKLSKFGWYWGPITRVEAEEKLANQTDGAFLVRDSSDERYLLSLSFRSYNRTLHTRIEHCNGVFSFYAQPESEGYTSIVDLIEHSMSDSRTGVFCYSRARTPGAISFPVRLTKPVSRFSQVRSLQYLCRFIIRQYTRLDHIQSLPLPASIKGWLEENQY